MKNLMKALLSAVLLVGLSACSNVSTFASQDPNTGKVLDRYHVMTDAVNPFAPASTTGATTDANGQFVITGFEAGASPFEQLAPVINGVSAVKAAEAIRPSSTTNNNQNIAEGGDAWSYAYNGGNFQVQTQEQWQQQDQDSFLLALQNNQQLMNAFIGGKVIDYHGKPCKIKS